MRHLAKWVMAASAALLAAAGPVDAQVTELRIGYQPSPLQDASVAMFETWGAKNGVKIVKVPNSYGVYVEKMTASLTSNSDQYDVIWHNDDWGQTWAHLLEPTDDVDANKYAEKWGMAPVVFANAQGQNTVVPMGQTFSVFFYRSDLVKPEEVPKTLAELVTVSKALQSANKVKFGYVGGMAMNHSWFSWLWSMWGNNCDVLMPPYERDNKKLAEAGWKSGMTEPCMQQTVEYWWDALHKNKISPEAMTTYGRNEANAIFEAGDAAFTVADSTFYGEFNDKNKSLVAGIEQAHSIALDPHKWLHAPFEAGCALVRDACAHRNTFAVTPEYLVGGNWDSRDFYVWDRTGKLVRKAAANTGNAYQDMKFEGGLLVASGLLPDHTGAVDWIEFSSFHLLKRLKFGSTERHAPFSREGMAIRGKQLLFLPEDEPSRLFVFNLDR